MTRLQPVVLSSEPLALYLLKALRRPLQLARSLIIHPLRMFMHPQLILLALLPHPLPLHDILSEDLGYAFHVFECVRGVHGAGLELGVEGVAGEFAGGAEGGVVIYMVLMSDWCNLEGEGSCAG